MPKHHTETEARSLASSTKRAKPKPVAAKRRRPAPLDAGVTRGVPKDRIPPDLMIKRIDDRHLVHVRLEAPLVAGCRVALLYIDKRFRTKIGRYWPGPPERFAEFVDPWGDDRSDKVGRRKPLGEGYPVRLVGLIVRYPRALAPDRPELGVKPTCSGHRRIFCV